jgi:hypothetical protein
VRQRRRGRGRGRGQAGCLSSCALTGCA